MEDRRVWQDRLERLAGSGGADPRAITPKHTPRFIDEFSDEQGHRRPSDRAFLSHVLGRTIAGCDQIGGVLTPEALWGRVAAGGPEYPALPGEPPMLERNAYSTIEVWTESLLSSMHALSWIGGHDSVRLDREVSWVIEHIEPDNATRHPWAVHLFLDRALRLDDPSAFVYADELLHVCRVSLGHPDRLSAWILMDSARWLDAGSSL